jgi:hypothetical protein
MTEKKPFWVDDVAHAYRWFSVQVQLFGVAVTGAFLMLDEQQRNALFGIVGVTPEQGVAVTAFITFLTGILARVKKQ